MILQGDCIEKLKELDDNSVEAVVTDPPYGLEFMGKDWDRFGAKLGSTTERWGEKGKTIPSNRVSFHKGLKASKNFQDFCYQWAKECLRVLKPGGYLLSFGGTRTYHRMAVAIEDAGFEIRDMIEWVYGSGFPKSHNIGVAVDKLQGNEREKLGDGKYAKRRPSPTKETNIDGAEYGFGAGHKITKGTSEWEGYGTALKPSHEPIVMARKPLSEKTVALNVLKWEVGGIDIDGSRVGNETIKGQKAGQGFNNIKGFGVNTKQGNEKAKDYISTDVQGRFPANLILTWEENEYIIKEDINNEQKKKVCTWLQKNL